MKYPFFPMLVQFKRIVCVCARSRRSRNAAVGHLHAGVCTEVTVADSRARSYLWCKGARDRNADALCSSVVIKRKGLSLLSRERA